MPRRDIFKFERFTDDDHGAKLAIGFDLDDDENGQIRGRLRALDWDDHHCQFDEDYTFEDGTSPAWTCDRDADTLNALRERDIPVPPVRDIPFNVDIPTIRNVERECRLCREDGVVSVRELREVYPVPDEAMRVALHDSTDATHFCEKCNANFHLLPREDDAPTTDPYSANTPDADGGRTFDDDDFSLADVM